MDKEKLSTDIISSLDDANFIIAAQYIRKASQVILYNDQQLSDGLIYLAKLILDKANTNNKNVVDDAIAEITK